MLGNEDTEEMFSMYSICQVWSSLPCRWRVPASCLSSGSRWRGLRADLSTRWPHIGHLSGVEGKVLPLSSRQEGWKRCPQEAMMGQEVARGRQQMAHTVWSRRREARRVEEEVRCTAAEQAEQLGRPDIPVVFCFIK